MKTTLEAKAEALLNQSGADLVSTVGSRVIARFPGVKDLVQIDAGVLAESLQITVDAAHAAAKRNGT